MALKFFGQHRMAAQQSPEDAGTSLVRNRPTWGMGPREMPGAHDYDARGPEARGREPNAYERGGFFWTGSGIAQGTPIGHQDQRGRLLEDDNRRHWARQALEDRKMGLNVRDVDARIRQTDSRHALDQERFGLDRERLGHGMRLDERRFDEDVAHRGHVRGMDERRFGLDTDRFDEDRLRADRGHTLNLTQQHRDERRFGLDRERLGIERDRLEQGDRKLEADAGRRAMERRMAGPAKANAGRFLGYYEQLGGQAYREDQISQLSGRPAVTMDAQAYLNRVDALAADPRLADVSEEQLAQLAMLDARWHGRNQMIVTYPNGRQAIVDLGGR